MIEFCVLATILGMDAVESELSRPNATVTTTVDASAQMGIGRLGEDVVGLVRPRLSWSGVENRLVVGMPLWFQLYDVRPTYRLERGPGWLTNWQRAETYAGLLERLVLTTADSVYRMEAGSLENLTFGNAVLIDAYNNRMDPVQRNTGFVGLIEGEPFELLSFVDSVTRPHLVGGRVAVRPWVLAGWPNAKSTEIYMESAVDVALPKQQAVASLDVGAQHLLWGDELAQLKTFAAWSTLGSTDWGLHGGLVFDLINSSVQKEGVRAVLEVVRSQNDYVAGYFGTLYDFERIAWSEANGRPKHMADFSSAWGGRVRLAGQLGRFDFSLSLGQRGVSESTQIAVQTRWHDDKLNVSLRWQNNGLQKFVESTHRFSNFALADLAYTFYDGWFTFSQARIGPRYDTHDTLRYSTSWLVGVGYAAATSG